MKQKYNGFTLIELMVSVALMLIIIGMTMVIFNSTSTTFTVAEAKVDIMQNARLALDTIAKDIANAIEINGAVPNVNAPTSIRLEVITITNYIAIDTATNPETSVTLTGKATVIYSITNQNAPNGLFFLQRRIIPHNLSNRYRFDLEQDPILAEFLVAPEATNQNLNFPLYFEYFMHPGTISTNWNEPFALLPYPPNPNPNNITSTDLPPLVRVTITVTDEFRTARRTLSRMIWIPKGIRRQ
jgi:prepilin-type N-terminal cleavage/methylation domain-containing protein